MTTDRIGVIADDFTGATDIAGLLARSLASDHFRNFDDTVRPWVIQNHVEMHERITP